ncbi:anti-sigma factor [Aquimarina aquimarini]|uniref:anti-sigma factor n=1 Tax=Aquimarina aquimarini TaxID=1191734 RepID=UPI000D54CDC1|nr:anti-sigma factor [Aquimarina aquimarini]
MTRNILLIAPLLLAVLFSSCSSDDDRPPTATIELETIGLIPLTGGSSYQGWLVVNGQTVPTKKFTNGSRESLEVLASDLENASQFIITIEPKGDIDDNKPSDAKILTGNFTGNSAQLTFENVVADISSVSGQFYMATPTDNAGGVDNGNDEFGVWFMSGTNAPGLTLPKLAKGWKYEGWVDFGGKILSTGTFADVDVTDDGNFFKGSGGTVPEFPGEDFLVLPSQIPLEGITLPAEVKSEKVYITIEPYQDNDPAPFFIKPLSANAGELTGVANPVVMIPNNAVPSGRATRPN